MLRKHKTLQKETFIAQIGRLESLAQVRPHMVRPGLEDNVVLGHLRKQERLFSLWHSAARIHDEVFNPNTLQLAPHHQGRILVYGFSSQGILHGVPIPGV